MGKYSGLFVDQLKGNFLTNYEGAYQQLWSGDIANFFEVDHEIVKYDDLGTVGAVRQWIGDRTTTDPIPYKIEITNQVYELSAKINVEDVRRDQLGLFDAKIAEMGRKMMLYRDSLAANIITTNPNAADGIAYFGTHYGSQANLVTKTQVPALQVAVPAAPTSVEAASALIGMFTYLFTLVDEAGDPINGGARSFTLLTSNPAVYAAFQNATFQTQLTSGQTNPVLGYNAKGFKFDIVFSPLLGAASSVVIYLFRNDSPVKPLILQQELAPVFKYLGPDSEYATETNNVFFGVKSVLGAGPGRWQHGLKGTLST